MKPPVEAPTSRQSLPRGSRGSSSSACASFSPPRETNRGGRSTSSDDRLVELRARLVVARDEPGDDERLRLAAGLREATLHEEDIEPLLHSRGRLAGCGRSESCLGITSWCSRAPRSREPDRRDAIRRGRVPPLLGGALAERARPARHVAPSTSRAARARARVRARPAVVRRCPGAADVTATDWARDAIDLVALNAAANGLAVTAAVLDWRDRRTRRRFTSISFLLPMSSTRSGTPSRCSACSTALSRPAARRSSPTRAGGTRQRSSTGREPRVVAASTRRSTSFPPGRSFDSRARPEQTRRAAGPPRYAVRMTRPSTIIRSTEVSAGIAREQHSRAPPLRVQAREPPRPRAGRRIRRRRGRRRRPGTASRAPRRTHAMAPARTRAPRRPESEADGRREEASRLESVELGEICVLHR